MADSLTYLKVSIGHEQNLFYLDDKHQASSALITQCIEPGLRVFRIQPRISRLHCTESVGQGSHAQAGP